MALRVVKVGGSLLGGRPEPVLPVLAENADGLVGVAGGGRIADAVRAADDRFDLSDRAAHVAAVEAMDINARILADLRSEFVLVDGPEGIAAAHGQDRLPILRTTGMVAGSPLPESWTVTSDSIAAWVADRIGARTVVLLKAVDGIRRDGEVVPRLSPDAPLLSRTDVVDDHLPGLLHETGIEAVLVSGEHPERVQEVLSGGTPVATRIGG